MYRKIMEKNIGIYGKTLQTEMLVCLFVSQNIFNVRHYLVIYYPVYFSKIVD